ncbi:MAG: hypothetical protein ACR2PI_15975 [Hyphomicrobiaceae bacterium]
MTDTAIDAIGVNAGGEPDYVLRPQDHARQLHDRSGEKVAPLVRILEQPDLQDTIEIYNLNDALAAKAQKKFIFRSQIAVWWLTYVIIIGAALAVFPPGQWGAPASWLVPGSEIGLGQAALILSGASAVLAALLHDGPMLKRPLKGLRKTFAWLSKGAPGFLMQLCLLLGTVGIVLLFFPPHAWMPDGQWSAGRTEFALYGLVFAFLFIGYCASRFLRLEMWRDHWMRHRGRAELARKQLFERVFASTAEAQSGELAALPLQLEYFRRYQLDVQRDYFEQRSRELRNEAAWGNGFSRFLIVVSVVLFLFLMSRAYAPITDQEPSLWIWQKISAVGQHWPETVLAKLALLVVIAGSALTGGWQAQAMINNNARNARRYENTLRNLRELERVGLAQARAAAADGRTEEVLGFVRAVHGLMAAELQEWIVLTEDEARQRIDAAYTPAREI